MDEIAFDLGEPQLHLLQLRAVRRREVQVHSGMVGEQRLDAFRLLGGEIVADDVDLERRGDLDEEIGFDRR